MRLARWIWILETRQEKRHDRAHLLTFFLIVFKPIVK